MGRKLVAYIRGGLGDTWLAISALIPIIRKEQISPFNITIISDSVYYFRNYPAGLKKYLLDALHKISSNVIMVPPHINNNFQLDINDITDELSQELANKETEFMFWRPQSLKDFVKQHIYVGDIFIDALFSECIMKWDFKKSKYERVGKERVTFAFNPTIHESMFINTIIGKNPKHILIHVRKKEEGTAHTENSGFYNSIIEYCNLNKITSIIIGVDDLDLKGNFIDWRGDNIMSFEGMCYLIDKCNVMLGNDSAFSHIKLYQQQKDKLLIMNHNRFERSYWCKEAFKKSNCLLLDAKENNIDKIIKAIGDYYENK